MVEIAICNDNEQELLQVEEFIKAYCRMYFLNCRISKYLSREKMLSDMTKRDFNVVFVCLNKVAGMETVIKAKELAPNAEYIWISDTDDFALQAYRLECTHYLLKPVTSENVCEALKRCRLYKKTRFGVLGHLFYPKEREEKTEE